MARKLFDGSDSDDDVSKIEIDEDFARKFEHNKKREDLQKFEERKKRGLISSSSGEENGEDNSDEESYSDEESNAWFIRPNKKKELEFLETLIRFRNQDPTLKNKDVELFKPDEEKEDQKNGEAVDKKEKKKKKNKAMYLKDVTAKHLIEEGPEFNSEDDDHGKKKTYNEEQEEMRKAFLDEMDAMEEDEEEELFRVKDKVDDGDGDGDGDGSDIEELKKKADEYFDGDENAIFLKNFILNRSWLQKEDKDDFQVGNDESEILAEDDRVDTIEESEYRFQEDAGDRIIGHSREVVDSVRKKVNARKEQRKRKEERMEIARLEREEELKYIKNLKKKEIDERVKKIMKSAGIREEEVVPLSAKELEKEFDPEEYDRLMNKAFGDKYYEAEDVDPGFGSDEDDGEIEKPDFEKEDELLGLPKGWDDCGDGDGFLAARERILKLKNDGDNEEEEKQEEDEDEEEEEEEVKEEGKRKRKRKTALLEKAKEALMDEYYKLDYEDTIGDLKTRFKYAKIKPNRYGLSAADILKTDEKELNQFVPLKKLAPYNEKEWKLPNIKRYQMKVKIKELQKEAKGNGRNIDKKKRIGNDAAASTSSRDAVEDEKAQLENSNGDLSNLSRKARRKQRQAHLKLSNSRLMAYGKVASKPNKKAEH